MTYEATVRPDSVEKEGAIEVDMIHIYPSTMVKISEYIGEATQKSRGWEDGHSSESNVRATYITLYILYLTTQNRLFFYLTKLIFHDSGG